MRAGILIGLFVMNGCTLSPAGPTPEQQIYINGSKAVEDHLMTEAEDAVCHVRSKAFSDRYSRATAYSYCVQNALLSRVH